MARQKGIKIIANNKKAFHDYFIDEKYEAGIELSGTEVKSIRQGMINLKESYITVRSGEIWLVGCHISPYENGGSFNRDPVRDRRLLMHKREIERLYGVMKQKGRTLVPTSCYFKNGRVKIEVGVARGKKEYDKREDIAEKDAKRRIARQMKEDRSGDL